MRQLLTISLSALAALCTTYIYVHQFAAPGTAVAPAKETAYERVMRTGMLRCGYVLWPPYFEKDQQTGELKGFTKDLVDQMATGIGLKVEYTAETLLGQQAQDLQTGKYDAVCFDSFIMPNITRLLDYTKPWFFLPNFVYGRAGEAPVSLETMNDSRFKFSAMDGDVSQSLAARSFPKAPMLSVPSTADPSLIMLNVTAKKADYVIIDPISVDKFNRSNPDKLAKAYQETLAVYPISFSVRKGEVDLANMLSYAVDVFVYTGSYDTIMRKYDPNGEFFIPVKKY